MKRISYKRRSQFFEDIYFDKVNEIGTLLFELQSKNPAVIKMLLKDGILKEIYDKNKLKLIHAPSSSDINIYAIEYKIVNDKFRAFYYEGEYNEFKELDKKLFK